MPLPATLLRLQHAQLLTVKQERGEDEFRQRLSVDATCGGDDEIGVLQTETLHERSDPGRSRLHPAQPRRQFQHRSLLILWKVP